ncbi:hypothetical protein VLK31_34680 [Variovorax sp. H27-G14]|uniref:hypothetical protein n=1 Tax=Variovorax sp. H27-G14 TaxID=3111914 RepID=UPI0038FBEF6F
MTARPDLEALTRKEFEAWAIEEGYAERNRYGLWFTNSVHEHSLWMGYQAADKAATERAAKAVEDTDTVEVHGQNSMYCQLGDASATRAACAAAIREAIEQPVMRQLNADEHQVLRRAVRASSVLVAPGRIVEVCPDCDIADCHHIRERRASASGGTK